MSRASPGEEPRSKAPGVDDDDRRDDADAKEHEQHGTARGSLVLAFGILLSTMMAK
jgi:hypothetical protein